MKQVYLCLSQQESSDLRYELHSLGYHVVEPDVDQILISDVIFIVDKHSLERYPTKFRYPILYSDQVVEDTMQTVLRYSCGGVIDASCRGLLLKSVVEACFVSKKERDQLLKENQKLNNKILDRRIIEKAKFILMKRMRTSEEEAYKRIRSRAMREQKSIREIADSILLQEE